jgi:pimeloyl-ACP methyl ester carboxylesterase
MSGFLLQRNRIPGVNFKCWKFENDILIKDHRANLNTPIFLGHGRDDFIVPYTYGQLTEQAVKAFNPKGFLIIKEPLHI